MRISVIVPSRLDASPVDGSLYLDRALESVMRQTEAVHEVCIGIQRGGCVPECIRAGRRGAVVRLCETDVPGQAAAVNAAVAQATGDLLAFLEDDDLWEPERIADGLEAMRSGGAEFASSTQTEVNIFGKVVNINDFATPSGWLMPRAVWDRVGGMDESFRWHVDTEFLGRINKAGIQRVHLVERDAKLEDRPELRKVALRSDIHFTRSPDPLVVRLRNPNGGMARIVTSRIATEQSNQEHAEMLKRYGECPW